MKNNYKVIVHFDGSEYKGWQYQGHGIRTIQEELVNALKIISKQMVTITGSSRTDAGVHSTGLTANFYLGINIDAESLQRAFNSILPHDIRIKDCEQVDASFNARFGAKSKTYVYRIFNGKVTSPFDSRFYAHVSYPLNRKKMKKATKFFIGEKDFSSFTSDDPHKNRIRTISEFKMKTKGEEIIFTIKGKSFLRYMVRNMIGTITDVGIGKIDLKKIPEIFEAKDRRAAGSTANPEGLTLASVKYD